jgi:hypothetical protein
VASKTLCFIIHGFSSQHSLRMLLVNSCVVHEKTMDSSFSCSNTWNYFKYTTWIYPKLKLQNMSSFLCFVDHASLYNLVNKTNLVHNFLLVYLSISTRFRWLCAHHQEKQPCLCDTCYSVWMTVCYAECIPDNHPLRITSTKCHKNTAASPDDGHIVTQNMYRLINILRIKCAPTWFYLQDELMYSST